MSKESLARTLRQWDQLLAASETNAADLDYLAAERKELAELAGKARELWIRQAALAAERQQVTRDLEAMKARGREVAVRMRSGIRSRYGLGAEKLSEFGLRPRRGRRTASQAAPARPETGSPPGETGKAPPRSRQPSIEAPERPPEGD